jgi:hypothetical protein
VAKETKAPYKQLERTHVFHQLFVYSLVYCTTQPLASAMLVCGFDTKAQLSVAKDVCVQMGEKFQIQVSLQTMLSRVFSLNGMSDSTFS